MSQRVLLIATLNNGKLLELREVLCDLPFTLRDLNSFPLIEPVEETGTTFVENASLKARSYAQQTRLMTLADDSGLEISCLDGAPGVRSARYAGEDASDEKRTNKLLAEVSKRSSADRTARFVSAVAIANTAGLILNISRGVCDGRIATVPRGPNGFGYDPIFIPNGYDQTFGELSASVKSQISHRARALKDTTDFLRSLTMCSGDS